MQSPIGARCRGRFGVIARDTEAVMIAKAEDSRTKTSDPLCAAAADCHAQSVMDLCLHSPVTFDGLAGAQCTGPEERR